MAGEEGAGEEGEGPGEEPEPESERFEDSMFSLPNYTATPVN